MITTFDLTQIHERNAEMRREAAANRLARKARANRQEQPYVVRELSWVFARFLNAQDSPASAPATQGDAN